MRSHTLQNYYNYAWPAGQHNATYHMQEHMATAYENKTPKVVIAALDIVTECLRYALPESSDHRAGDASDTLIVDS